MDLFSILSFHFMCVTVTVVTGHSVALNRRSHLFSTMSSLHDVVVHDMFNTLYVLRIFLHSTPNTYRGPTVNAFGPSNFQKLGRKSMSRKDMFGIIAFYQDYYFILGKTRGKSGGGEAV
jgi:hypothetical protein